MSPLQAAVTRGYDTCGYTWHRAFPLGCSSTLDSTLPCKDLDPATLQLLQTQAWWGGGGGAGQAAEGRQDTTAFKEAPTLSVMQVHGQPLRVSASLNVAP